MASPFTLDCPDCTGGTLSLDSVGVSETNHPQTGEVIRAHWVLNISCSCGAEHKLAAGQFPGGIKAGWGKRQDNWSDVGMPDVV